MSDHRAATPALVAKDLVKVYAGGARALDGLRLVRIPAGRLRVFGRDVVADSGAARQLLGLAPQEVHFDRFLTSREGLVYHGRYFGMTKKEAETLCRRIAFIRAGRIVAEGSPEDLRARYRGDRLEDVYCTLMGGAVEPAFTPEATGSEAAGSGNAAPARRGFVGLDEAPVALSLLVAAMVSAGLIALGTRMLARGWRLKP
jgi:hypothetical protein